MSGAGSPERSGGMCCLRGVWGAGPGPQGPRWWEEVRADRSVE